MEVENVYILRRLLHSCLVVLAVAVSGQAAHAANLLWTQDSDGQFVVIDVVRGTSKPAPVQPDHVPYNFAYDPHRRLIWMLVQDWRGFNQVLVATFDPVSGATNYLSSVGASGTVYSLSYRPSDGHLYAFFNDGTQAWLMRLDPLAFVCQVQSELFPWKGAYNVTTLPPQNLCFDPVTDQAYFTSPPETDANALFTLNLSTGVSTPMASLASATSAMTFYPGTQKLYLVWYNQNNPFPPGFFFWSNLAAQRLGINNQAGQGNLIVRPVPGGSAESNGALYVRTKTS